MCDGRVSSSSSGSAADVRHAAGARTGIEVRCQDSITDSMAGNAVPPTIQHKLPSEQHLIILECAIDIVGNIGGMDAQLCAELETAGVCECVLLLLINTRTPNMFKCCEPPFKHYSRLGNSPTLGNIFSILATWDTLAKLAYQLDDGTRAGSDSKSIPDESLVKVKDKNNIVGTIIYFCSEISEYLFTDILLTALCWLKKRVVRYMMCTYASADTALINVI